jgi:diguanylate cyclase (GGDEF)-like protein
LDGRLTVGVLSTFLGGPYHGGLLTGIQRATAAAGGRVIAIQTQDGGTVHTERPEPPPFRLPIAWDLISGFIVLVRPVEAAYLERLRAAGKQFVVVSHRYAGVDAPAVLPDNRSGVRQAVAHLIKHGHRRIAFAGYLPAFDVQQRYEAYRDTLLEYEIEPDPDLVFEADSNQETGGACAAAQMLKAAAEAGRLTSTAVVAGTDNNAIGIMSALVTAGYRLPADQAVVGFDDMASAEYTTPSLASVRQPLDDIGATAVELLARQLGHTAVPAAPLIVPTIFTPRASCGCAGPFSRPARDRARHQYDRSTHLQTTLSTQFEVSMDLLRSHEQNPRTLDWLQRTQARAGSLALWTGEPADGAMELAGNFGRDTTALQECPLDKSIEVRAFPPRRVIEAAETQPVQVVSVRHENRDWGVLAVVNEIEDRVPRGRELVNQSAALLAVALDHETVLHSLRKQEDQLRRAALYDELTSLPNRALFMDRLRMAVNRARRRPEVRPGYAVLFIDLDGFKVVNDSLGHSVGDRLLAQVARRISVGLRDNDTAARFGGDEFLVLLDDIDDAGLPDRVARRLHTVLAGPFHLDGQEVVVTGSIGIALGDERYDNADDVLRDADLAMYWAKSHEKGTHAVFSVSMHTTAMNRLRIEAELRQAVEHDELEVYYQPIVALDTGKPAGFEALVRWRHPTRGLLRPREFMAVAEESGLSLLIGRMVLGEACRQFGEWRAAMPGTAAPPPISVNISNRQFWHGRLLDDVDEFLDRLGIDPPSLALEITEGVVMRRVDQARKTLGQLQDRGVRIHIDDFGTGYSSLEALHHLPIDALKIDRSFVSRLGVDNRSAELVRTIVLMAGNLGLDVIAEGVESTEQQDELRRLGTTYGQGYLYSAPVAGAAATELLRRRAGEA